MRTPGRYDHANMNLLGATAARASLRFYLDITDPSDVEAHLYILGKALWEKLADIDVQLAGPPEREHHAPHLYPVKLCGEDWARHFKEHNVAVTSFRWGVRVTFGFYNNLGDVQRFVVVSGGEGGLREVFVDKSMV